MWETGADFVFTGEVIGQRPKSQVKNALRAIEKATGLEGRLLRPLSAQVLPPTEVEERGLVDREKLYGLAGRGRKPQIELARKYGLTTFMQPAGGCCFLTDKAYSDKFRDLIEHGDAQRLAVEDVFVLGVGRHFRLSPNLKVVVGRDEIENNFLSYYTDNRWSAIAAEFPGPFAVIIGDVADDDWESIASIVARYSGGKNESMVDVRFVCGDDVKVVGAAPATTDFLDDRRV
jgi:tRNA U34 2-thiouridine synthase MnmA/TrmU